MTEPSIRDLYEGIHAHRHALVRFAGDAAEDSVAVAGGSRAAAELAKELSDFTVMLTSAKLGHYAGIVQKMARRASVLSRSLLAPADRQRTMAEHLGLSLEALVRLADGTQDPTEPGIPLAELAASEAGVCPTCGQPVDDGTGPR